MEKRYTHTLSWEFSRNEWRPEVLRILKQTNTHKTSQVSVNRTKDKNYF